MVGSNLAIVVPCHNEELTIFDIVSEATTYGDVFVVDDRSTDKSTMLARKSGANVLAAASSGYDGALTTGLQFVFSAGYQQVVTLDADGEHSPRELVNFKNALDSGTPLICGFRPTPQRAAEYIVGLYSQLTFGVSDLLCGMKGYSREVLALYLASGKPLLINMAPTILWRRAGGAYRELLVTGVRRSDQPRFGKRWAANVAILSALREARRL